MQTRTRKCHPAEYGGSTAVCTADQAESQNCNTYCCKDQLCIIHYTGRTLDTQAVWTASGQTGEPMPPAAPPVTLDTVSEGGHASTAVPPARGALAAAQAGSRSHATMKIEINVSLPIIPSLHILQSRQFLLLPYFVLSPASNLIFFLQVTVKFHPGWANAERRK